MRLMLIVVDVPRFDLGLSIGEGTDAPICQDGIVKVNRLEPGRKAS